MSRKSASDVYAEFQKNKEKDSSVVDKINQKIESDTVSIEELSELFVKPEKKKKKIKNSAELLTERILEAQNQKVDSLLYDAQSYENLPNLAVESNHIKHPLFNISKSKKYKVRNLWKK